MTFKEKLEIEHPEEISEEYDSGCFGCPHDYGYEPISESVVNCDVYGGKGCVHCWNREMEATKVKAKVKKEFNWEEFKDVNNKIAVHCKTEKEAKDFCKQMHEHGITWCDGVSYLDDTHFIIHKEETAYDANGSYCYVGWYKREGYRILEWSDYMTTENGKEQTVQEFTKADLKYGYLVELRNREKILYMPFEDGNIFDFCNGFQCLNLKCYSDNLLYNKDRRTKDFDVMRVYGYTNIPEKTTQLTTGHRKLIWKRKESKQMTAEEMRQKLEELTGEKIEIKLSVDDKRVVLTNYCKSREKCGGCPFYNNTGECFGLQDVFVFENEDVENLYNKLKQNN